jgi:hypothetical protein
MQFAIYRRITAADLVERAKEQFSNTNPPPADRVQLLAWRYEHGLDLFSGKPLEGRDLRHWQYLQQEHEEQSAVPGSVRSQLQEAMVVETA